MPTKSWKNHPKKLIRKTQIHFFPLLPWAAQTAQTEEFMFQNVAIRPTVYRTGVVGRCPIMDKIVNVVYERPYMLPGKQAAAQKYLCKCILPIFSQFFYFSFSWQ